MRRDEATLMNHKADYRNELNRAIKKMNIEQPESMEKPRNYDPII